MGGFVTPLNLEAVGLMETMIHRLEETGATSRHSRQMFEASEWN